MSLHIHITKLMKKTNLLNQSTMEVLAPNEEPPYPLILAPQTQLHT